MTDVGFLKQIEIDLKLKSITLHTGAIAFQINTDVLLTFFEHLALNFLLISLGIHSAEGFGKRATKEDMAAKFIYNQVNFRRRKNPFTIQMRASAFQIRNNCTN